MIMKLKDICDFQSGGTPSKRNSEFFNGTIPWITTTALNNSKINEACATEWITESAIVGSAAKIVPAHSIMVGTRVGVGKVAINTVKMSTNQDIIALLNIDERNWSKEYLCKFIQSKFDYLNSQSRGATIKGIKIDVLANLKITQIPLNRQKEVSKTIDKVQKILEDRKKQLQGLDKLVKARFVELFGDVVLNDKHWETQEFSKVTDSRLGKMLDAKRQTGQSSFPYLANANVQWFRFEVDCLNEMDFNEAEQKEFALEEGDLLVCEGGEIGRCAIWHNQVQPCFFQKALHRVRCKQGIILPDYLAWWFKFNCENNGFTAIEGAKATIAHLPGAKLKKLRVVIPPLSLQNQFADFVTQVDKSKVVA